MNGVFRHDNALSASVCVCAIICAFVTFFYSPFLACVEVGIIVSMIVWLLISRRFSGKRFRKLVIKLSKKLDYTDENVLASFPFPSIVCEDDGTVRWFSEGFIDRVIGGNKTKAVNILEFTNGKDLSEILNSDESAVFVFGRSYTVYSNSFEHEDENLHVLYYVDNTNLRLIESRFIETRPWVIMIEADNVGDSRLDLRDSERAEINGLVEAAVENWSSSYKCIMKRLGGSRYMIIAENVDVEKMMETKFPILDTVREIKYKNVPIFASLAIGAADGENLVECESRARNSLGSALARGGDQAVVSIKDTVRYFGGSSSVTEKQDRSGSRRVGKSLSELIAGSDNVIIMGHKQSDLDCLGAALGIYSAAVTAGVRVNIAADVNSSLAKSVFERMNEDEYYQGAVVDREKALELIDRKTLLVLVDCHIVPNFDFPELIAKAQTKVVIDHHRKAEKDIAENVTVFSIDTTASSASEMVSELLQYIKPTPVLPQLTCEALLAGIMLDTRNFVFRTGVHTFEAAAFLRLKGADTVQVSRLFSNSMEANKLRNSIISQAERYRDCAISVFDMRSEDARVISSQAADELLNVTDVKASFVLYGDDSSVSISARSLGGVNVQRIMEELGGGGHLTMAGTYMAGETFDSAKDKLISVIDLVLDGELQ